MRVKISIAKGSSKHLVIEPWGEEFLVNEKEVEIILSSIGPVEECEVEIDCAEQGFLRIENPPGFRPVVLIDGQEDERPAFAIR